MKLRNYQEKAIQKVIEGYKKGILNQLLSLPTGSVKTVIFSYLTKSFLEKIQPSKKI